MDEAKKTLFNVNAVCAEPGNAVTIAYSMDNPFRPVQAMGIFYNPHSHEVNCVYLGEPYEIFGSEPLREPMIEMTGWMPTSETSNIIHKWVVEHGGYGNFDIRYVPWFQAEPDKPDEFAPYDPQTDVRYTPDITSRRAMSHLDIIKAVGIEVPYAHIAPSASVSI